MAAAPRAAGAISRRTRAPGSYGGTVRGRPPGFPVVGLGASAGGLDALERFFGKLPPVTGMAFVVVSHLDPDHDSILPDILQRSTSLRVSEAQDGTKLAPDCVYVLRPGFALQVSEGKLRLSLPKKSRGHRMPIDFFLCSLAEEKGAQAIGIILSGTGTDGSLGLQAIGKAGGLVLVQQPESARFSGMPLSAIKLARPSQILPPEQLSETVMTWAQAPPADTSEPVDPALAGSVAGILELLRAATGHDFSRYKKTTILRRIERRMLQHGLGEMALYERYCSEHPEEVQLLFRELLINVTSFFRDPEAFSALGKEVLPRLLEGKSKDSVFRAWVPGCASGEEAYSLAILLREALDASGKTCKVQIYATDLADHSVAAARAGLYPASIAANVSAERLRRFFVSEDGGYRVRRSIREMIVFAVQDVGKDPPFTRLDLVSCRNLMIYLEPALQSTVLATFQYALMPGGVLFLSPSETVGESLELFTPLNRHWKFYEAAEADRRYRTTAKPPVLPPANLAAHSPGRRANAAEIADLARRTLLQCCTPASVVTDLAGTILYVHGETGGYLRPAPGLATLNLAEMVHAGLQQEVHATLRTMAAKPDTLMISKELSYASPHEPDGRLLLTVRPLGDRRFVDRLLLFNFADAPPAAASPGSGPAATRRRPPGAAEAQRLQEFERSHAELSERLHAVIEEQQSANEELKSANEELQSTNEELQSTNEELQSTNEELETSQEELQSVNDELVNVNVELQEKIEQLAELSDDIRNLLDTSNVGMIFVDKRLTIRRFNHEACCAYKLVPTDVGRSLADIKTNLLDEDLLDETRAVFGSTLPHEREVHTATAAYLARMEPYRTMQGDMEGVVLTFTDITTRVEAEHAVQEARALAEAIVNTVREPLLVLDADLSIVSASRSFLQTFDLDASMVVGLSIYQVDSGQWDLPPLHELLERMLPQQQVFDDYVVERQVRGQASMKMILNARRILRERGAAPLLLLAIELCPAPASEAAVQP